MDEIVREGYANGGLLVLEGCYNPNVVSGRINRQGGAGSLEIKRAIEDAGREIRSLVHPVDPLRL